MKKITGAIAVALTLVSMTGCASSIGSGDSGSSSGRSNDINSAFSHCSKTDPNLSYDFHTLTANEPASDTAGLQCVITDLQISDGVAKRMDATKPMDGQQSATESGLNIAWSISVDASGAEQVFAQFSPS